MTLVIPEDIPAADLSQRTRTRMPRTSTTPRPSDPPSTMQPFLELDRAITALGPKITVLKAIAWPKGSEESFLEHWRKGDPRIPEPAVQPVDKQSEREAFLAIMRRCDTGHPIGRFLHHTAWSYAMAADMLTHIGKPRFTECSALLYGRPDFQYRTQTRTNLDAAEEMLRITDDLIGGYKVPPALADLDAETFAELLRGRIGDYFADDSVEVVIDPKLASKATAGSRKIKVRIDALFSELDLEQLTQHEAFIHTGTALNGKRQPWLTALGLGAPRTTRTQEGLATFSEIITNALDIVRLRRLALRVRMVKMALDGADFIEVFKGFLDGGQTEEDAYKSAERVFRGGDPRGGGICFTKDATYLEGTFTVSLFIRKALQVGRPELIPHLFAGRLTLGDSIALAPFFEDGTLVNAHYMPPWARDPRRLLALIAFFAASQRFTLDTLELERFTAFEEEQITSSGLH